MMNSDFLEMTTNSTKTERVRVEISVQKGLLGFPVSPSQYYVAVVGTGLQLGNENPDIAPRCNRIGNNIWVKEIWVPKDSWVSFKFLIVHTPTNRIVQTEDIPYHNIYISDAPACVETMFNQVKLKGGRGFGVDKPSRKHECNDRDTVQNYQEVKKEAEISSRSWDIPQASKQKAKQIEQANDAGEEQRGKVNDGQRNEIALINTSELTKLHEFKPSERQSSSDHDASNGEGDVRKDSNKICRADMHKVINEISKDFKMEKVLIKRGDIFEIEMRINQSVLRRFDLRPKDIVKAAEGIGLRPTQSLSDMQDGFFRQRLCLPEDMVREYMCAKTADKNKLTKSDKETHQVKADDIHSTSVMKNGTILPKTRLCRGNPTTTCSIYRRDRSLRPIISGITHKTTRALPWTLDKQSAFLGNIGPKTIREHGEATSITKSSYIGPKLARTTRTVVERPPRYLDIIKYETKKASYGIGKPPESTITIETKAFTEHVAEPTLTETAIAYLSNEPEETDVGKASDTKGIQLDQPSMSWKIPFNPKGLILVATGIAVAACIKYFVF